MDSLTQITTGALIGEKTLGRTMGNQAALWGAIIGTIPDLDVFLAPFFGPVENLFFHRGISHSLLFCLLAAPLLGWMLRGIYRQRAPGFYQWTLFSLWILLGAVFIDYLTTYGASIFWPFSDYRIELSTMAIVDVFFTLPLIIAMIIILTSPKHSGMRSRIKNGAFYFALIYLLFSGVNKAWQQRSFSQALQDQGISYERLRTQPMPLTNFLWMGLAETEHGYWLGYHSLFDSQKPAFEFIPRNQQLLKPHMENPKVKRLIGFTKNYYTVRQEDSKLILHDLRFGRFQTKDRPMYVFSFEIQTSNKTLQINEKQPGAHITGEDIMEYVRKIFPKNG